MQLSREYQELVDFFSKRDLPAGPQHINEFSVFLNLAGAVKTNLQRLYSEVEASHQSASNMLTEVRQWLIGQETANQ